jgi:hypothetical protein
MACDALSAMDQLSTLSELARRALFPRRLRRDLDRQPVPSALPAHDASRAYGLDAKGIFRCGDRSKASEREVHP